MADVRCPACGEDDDLAGERQGDAVVITCGACDTSFDRTLTPTCQACGSQELVPVATNLLEDAGRGDMTTPTGFVERLLCWGCGAQGATRPGARSAGPGWREARAASGLIGHLRTRD